MECFKLYTVLLDIIQCDTRTIWRTSIITIPITGKFYYRLTHSVYVSILA